MKDVKIIAFQFGSNVDVWGRKLHEQPSGSSMNQSVYDFPNVAKTLLPYLQEGYRITQFVSDGSFYFLLERD